MRDRRFDRLLPPLFARDTGCSMNSIDDLVSGYRRFRKGAYSTQRARFDVLANQGQSPKVMVIACSDSRVDPTMIFDRSEEHTSELQSLMRISYAVFCLKKKKQHKTKNAINVKL